MEQSVREGRATALLIILAEIKSSSKQTSSRTSRWRWHSVLFSELVNYYKEVFNILGTTCILLRWEDWYRSESWGQSVLKRKKNYRSQLQVYCYRSMQFFWITVNETAAQTQNKAVGKTSHTGQTEYVEDYMRTCRIHLTDLLHSCKVMELATGGATPSQIELTHITYSCWEHSHHIYTVSKSQQEQRQNKPVSYSRDNITCCANVQSKCMYLHS